jgi:predicted metal-dependent hydrolase
MNLDPNYFIKDDVQETNEPVGNLQKAQELLTKMQEALQDIKSTKTNQDILQTKIKQLVEQLAEKQAEEEKIAEEILNLEIAWQDLTKEFSNIGDLSDSSNQSSE